MEKTMKFFRKQTDLILKFLLSISNPKYLTEEGQEKVDGLIKTIGKQRGLYLKKLTEDSA